MNVRTVAAVVLGTLALGIGPASAQVLECHPKTVRAKGGPGLIEATAKSRARSAWIKRVRADRRLGPSYAAWLRARDPSYVCRKVARHLTCEAAALPCRLDGVTTR